MRIELEVEDKPLDCVFCGDFHVKDEHFEDSKGKHEYFVRCGLCAAHGPIRTTMQEAIKSWNRRVFGRIGK